MSDHGEPHRVLSGDSVRSAPHARGGGAPADATRALSRRARAALPLDVVGAGMLVRRVSVRPSDVVFVKGLVEASDGLAAVFAERGGELLLAAPRGREAELDELLSDLEAELCVCAWMEPRPDGPSPSGLLVIDGQEP